MESSEQDFALRLTRLYKELGFNTMSAFADAIGVSSSIIQKYLGKNGHYTIPNGKTLDKIKINFPQVNMNWLVSGANSPFEPKPKEPPHLGGSSGSECCISLEKAQSEIARLEAELEEKKLLISLLRAQLGK